MELHKGTLVLWLVEAFLEIFGEKLWENYDLTLESKLLEFQGALLFIETTWQTSWIRFWLDTDSSTIGFQSSSKHALLP